MEIFEALVIAHPKASIIIISMAITLISTLLMKHFTDQDHLRALKKRQKELQKDIKEAQKRKEFTKLEELNKEVMDITLTMMKSSFNIKMMFITLIPFLLLFSWLRSIYNPSTPDADPLLNYWFWWYLGTAIFSSMIFRKIFKMA